MESLLSKGSVLDSRKVERGVLGPSAGDAHYVLEHPRLPFVSYPYEWSFYALKDAAILHLDIQMEALGHGVTLSDATAYNVQFLGPKPVFIDRLSFVRYTDGAFWAGHRQFTEQFLNPLLLRALFGIPHNGWYRGTLEGLPAEDLKRLLKFHHKFSWNIFCHVILQSTFQASVTRSDTGNHGKKISSAGLPRPAFERMLRRLKAWIEKLEPAKSGKTVWQDYAGKNSYLTEDAEAKRNFVGKFAREVKPAKAWDLGCNTGDFSKVLLENGVQWVIGFDFDQGAIDGSFARAKSEELNMQPLFLDAANPSPGQGWNERERMGLGQRADADAIIALAFVHHLAIGKNIPLHQLVDWLVGLAPQGIIEFVPKQDPMVKELLMFRKDIFPDYSEEHFISCLSRTNEIIEVMAVTDSGRKLFWYKRKNNK